MRRTSPVVHRMLLVALLATLSGDCNRASVRATNEPTSLELQAAPSELVAVKSSTNIVLHSDTSVRPPSIAGALQLGDGRIVVAYQDSARLVYHHARGGIIKTVDLRTNAEDDSRIRLVQLIRVNGDTIAALAMNKAFLLDGTGAVIRRVDTRSTNQLPARIAIIMGMLRGDRTIAFLVGDQSPRGRSRWIDSVTLVILDRELQPTFQRPLPALFLAHKNNSFQQVWFAPTAVFASTDTTFYYGFPDRFKIDEYSSTGEPLRAITRSWNKVDVTSDDIETYIEGWGKRWITDTGEAGARRKREMRSDPFFEYVPAFSQSLIGPTGQLWVRSPNLIDAQLNGELYTYPLRPSEWSVFDSAGRWSHTITLPERFLATDLRANEVLGIEYAADRRRSIVSYRIR